MGGCGGTYEALNAVVDKQTNKRPKLLACFLLNDIPCLSFEVSRVAQAKVPKSRPNVKGVALISKKLCPVAGSSRPKDIIAVSEMLTGKSQRDVNCKMLESA